MIRRSSLSLNQANPGKLSGLDFLCQEMTRVINVSIQSIWCKQDFKSKFFTDKTDTWLSARLQQALGKQALEMVKSQRKKKKKTMPVFRGGAFNLDARFIDYKKGTGSFDSWLRLSSLGNKLQIKIPLNYHKHYRKFDTWHRLGSVRLLKKPNGYFLEVFFEKEEPKKKAIGKIVGVDCGYKKLLVSSENKILDTGLHKVYEKIARKKQGSKAFIRSLRERDNKINESVNKLDLTDIKEIVAEDLKNVKKGTKGKFRKEFNNKLQRWSYSKVLSKLSRLTEEAGILFTKVNPAYTSQKCSSCGVVCKENRCGESYRCSCGNEMDADYNAALNLSHMGVYSPHALQLKLT